jgi:hypothetical protein
MVEMEVEASLVDDDGYSTEVFGRCSTQGWMGKKVQIIDACSNKLEVKNEEEKKKGLT